MLTALGTLCLLSALGIVVGQRLKDQRTAQEELARRQRARLGL